MALLSGSVPEIACGHILFCGRWRILGFQFLARCDALQRRSCNEFVLILISLFNLCKLLFQTIQCIACVESNTRYVIKWVRSGLELPGVLGVKSQNVQRQMVDEKWFTISVNPNLTMNPSPYNVAVETDYWVSSILAQSYIRHCIDLYPAPMTVIVFIILITIVLRNLSQCLIRFEPIAIHPPVE